MDKTFDDFLSSCNKKSKTEYFPKLIEKFKKSNENLISERGTIDYSIFAINILDLSSNFANDVALLHIKNYHEWLTQNYNITPKE